MRDLQEIYAEFRQEVDRINAYTGALMLMGYDMETGMPKGAMFSRAKHMGILTEEAFKLQTSEKLGALLAELSPRKEELEDIPYRLFFDVNEEYEKRKRIPPEFMRAYQEDQSLAWQYWQQAKEANDFSIFAPWLVKMIDYAKREAAYIDPKKPPYDVLLNEYERGMTVEALDPFFAKLRAHIVPLLGRIAESGHQPDISFMSRPVPVEVQRQLSAYLIRKIGYDLNRGQLRETEHPFTSGGRNDARITTHYHINDFASALFSTIHEGGHAVYQQNVMEEIADTPLEDGSSLGIHESQSRFYENIIGRSPAFWDNIYEAVSALLGDSFADVSKEMFVAAVNTAKPSLIRIEADELSYCLHIMVRYELEKQMIGGDIDVNDLPRLWNGKYKEYLGLDVPDNARGVLQDVHWSNGSFGYFPTYALGSAYGAQFLHAMRKDLDVDTLIASGRLCEITAWLRERVQKYGKARTPEELLLIATGEKFNPDYYINYLEEKFCRVYGLE